MRSQRRPINISIIQDFHLNDDNLSRNDNSFFCTLAKFHQGGNQRPHKILLTNQYIRARTSYLLSKKNRSVSVSERKIEMGNIIKEKKIITNPNELHDAFLNQTKSNFNNKYNISLKIKKENKKRILNFFKQKKILNFIVENDHSHFLSFPAIHKNKKLEYNKIISITDEFLSKQNTTGSIPIIPKIKKIKISSFKNVGQINHS